MNLKVEEKEKQQLPHLLADGQQVRSAKEGEGDFASNVQVTSFERNLANINAIHQQTERGRGIAQQSGRCIICSDQICQRRPLCGRLNAVWVSSQFGWMPELNTICKFIDALDWAKICANVASKQS
jgi:hypothetical protein